MYLEAMKDSTATLLDNAQFALRATINGSPLLPPGMPWVNDLGEFLLPIPPQSVEYGDGVRGTTFPLSEMTTRSEVRGLDTPTINISGTMGMLERDGYDGYEWQRNLETYVRWFFQAQVTAGKNRTPIPEMEWHDVLRDEHWYVQILQTPYGRQDASTPIRESYILKMKSLRKTGTPPKLTREQSTSRTTLAASLCPLYPACQNPDKPFKAGCVFRKDAP